MTTREPSSRQRRLAEDEVVFHAADEAVKDVADDFVARRRLHPAARPDAGRALRASG